jgi:hypothetical protein
MKEASKPGELLQDDPLAGDPPSGPSGNRR